MLEKWQLLRCLVLEHRIASDCCQDTITVLPQHLMVSMGLRAWKHGLSQPVLALPLPSGTGTYSRTLGSQDFSGGAGEEATPGTSNFLNISPMPLGVISKYSSRSPS